MPSQRRWFSYKINVNRTPGDPGLLTAFNKEAAAFGLYADLFTNVDRERFPSAAGYCSGISNVSPVIVAHSLRITAERQTISLDTRAGRECQVRKMVPVVS